MLSQEAFETLMARQQELESASLKMGSDNFQKTLAYAEEKGRMSTAGAGVRLLQAAIEPMEKGVQALIADSKGKRGRPHIATKFAEQAGADVVAFITARVVLDTMSDEHPPAANIATKVADLILDELRFRKFQREAPGLFTYRMAQFDTPSYAFMARSMKHAMRFRDLDASEYDISVTQRIVMGLKLIDIFIETTGLVEKVSGWTPRKTQRDHPRGELYLEPTDETLAWIEKRNAVLETLHPVLMPMVVPPLPWSPDDEGGYRFALRGKHPFIRNQRRLPEGRMQAVYDAVNHVQRTAWRINGDVLALAQEIISTRQHTIAGLPEFQEEEQAPRPADIDTDKEVKRKWKKREAQRIQREKHRRLDCIDVERTVRLAARFRDDAAIFFPYNVDFRGRLYPLCARLSPQGDDLSKALLTFAEAKPLGEHGAAWLAIHGANCLGDTPQGQKVSRMTLQERIDWVCDNRGLIEQVANRPLEDAWWANPDESPMQFFAFCKEWCRLLAWTDEGLAVADFTSALPCAQDGTCNGLQHFAALLLDTVGGSAVNVIPSERPQDVYQRVADSVNDQLQEMATRDELAAKWLASGLVTRKLTKRPTMTFGYGSKKFGFVEQLREYVEGKEEAAIFIDPETGKDSSHAACILMAELIWNALRSSVVAAFDGMAWLQTCARAVVKSGKPVRWTVPATGFEVTQVYFKTKRLRVTTVLAGEVVRPSAYAETDEIATHKQTNSIAPNVVHSLDAAALMLTVNAAAVDGIEHFGMVHDSYATVPGDAELLARHTRLAFVRLYTETNVVQSLCEQFREQAKKASDVPEPPTKGELDLGLVIVSEYFFC